MFDFPRQILTCGEGERRRSSHTQIAKDRKIIIRSSTGNVRLSLLLPPSSFSSSRLFCHLCVIF